MLRLFQTSTRFNQTFKLPEHIQQIKNKRCNLKQQAKDDAATLFHLETSGFPSEFVTNKILPAIQTKSTPKLTSPLKIPIQSYVDQLNGEIYALEQEYSSTKDVELLQLYTPTINKLKCAEIILKTQKDLISSDTAIGYLAFFKLCALSPVKNTNVLITDADLLEPLKSSCRSIQFCPPRSKQHIPVQKPDSDIVKKFKFYNITQHKIHINRVSNFEKSFDKNQFDKISITPLHINTRMSLNDKDNQPLFNRIFHETEKSELVKFHKDIRKTLFNVCNYSVAESIIYSTESLAESMNENIVNAVAKQLTLEDHDEVKRELKIDTVFHEVLREVFSDYLNFKDTELGTFVYPTIVQNVGPFYLCKLSVQ